MYSLSHEIEVSNEHSCTFLHLQSTTLIGFPWDQDEGWAQRLEKHSLLMNLLRNPTGSYFFWVINKSKKKKMLMCTHSYGFMTKDDGRDKVNGVRLLLPVHINNSFSLFFFFTQTKWGHEGFLKRLISKKCIWSLWATIIFFQGNIMRILDWRWINLKTCTLETSLSCNDEYNSPNFSLWVLIVVRQGYIQYTQLIQINVKNTWSIIDLTYRTLICYPFS